VMSLSSGIDVSGNCEACSYHGPRFKAVDCTALPNSGKLLVSQITIIGAVIWPNMNGSYEYLL